LDFSVEIFFEAAAIAILLIIGAVLNMLKKYVKRPISQIRKKQLSNKGESYYENY